MTPRISDERVATIKDSASLLAKANESSGQLHSHLINPAILVDLLADIEDYKAEITGLEKEIVWGFYEERTPQFAQGPNRCELASPVTSEECKGYVRRIAELEAALAKTITPLTKFRDQLFAWWKIRGVPEGEDRSVIGTLTDEGKAIIEPLNEVLKSAQSALAKSSNAEKEEK